MCPDKKPSECTFDQDASTDLQMQPVSATEVRVRPPLLTDRAREHSVHVDGHELKLTRLDKVLFPKHGYNKRDVINFYERIADFLLPYLKDRPLTLKRYPDGVDSEFFFQKRAVEAYPDWLTTRMLVTSEGEDMEVVVCNDRATLIFLTNLTCIDQNPWISRLPHLLVPDFMVLNLDPQDCPFDMVVEAALVLKSYLERIGLRGFPKLSGFRGLHIYVPLALATTFEQTRNLAHVLARLGAAERPDLFTLPRTVGKRETGRSH